MILYLHSKQANVHSSIDSSRPADKHCREPVIFLMVSAKNMYCRPDIPALVVICVAVFATGCSSSRVLQESPPPVEANPPASDTDVGRGLPEQEVDPGDAPVQTLLRAEIDRWEGTPHRWGGTTPSGADCSGFVVSVYRDRFGLSLPRTTSEQALYGRGIHKHDLRAGDLVFFRPSKRTNHVGIYLENGEFAHISSSRGLMISRLDESYWRRSYWTARRVLAADVPRYESASPQVTEQTLYDESSRSRSRNGW